jgi:hypothetical protein
MPVSRNPHPGATEERDLDPRRAAELLAEATRRAERQFEMRPPYVLAVGATAVLLGYGGLWYSVRDQDPYGGPSLGAVGLIYGLVAVSIGVSATLYRRASAGVSGPSVRQQRIEGLVILVSYLGSPMLQGALRHLGASDGVVYGIVPAACPLVIVGTTVAGIAAGKGDRVQVGSGMTVALGGLVALWAGPRATWLVAGAGLFVGIGVYAALSARDRGRRLRRVGPPAVGG